MRTKSGFYQYKFYLNKITQGLILSSLTLSTYVMANDDLSAENKSVKADITSQSTEISNDDVIELEQVVVTARRREEKVQDVPTAITVLSGKTLETQRISRVEDLQQALPNLNVAFSNPRQASVSIRGLGNNPGNDGLEASAGVYLDNVFLGRPGMAVFDILDVAQLELLRGPQGTLFGKNTTAGILNISSKAPTFYPDNHLEVSAGERNYFQAKGSLSNALSDTVAGRLSFYKTSQDGFITNLYNGSKLNSTDRQGLRGQILWKPQDNFDLRWITDYNKFDDTSGATVLYSAGPIYTHPTFGTNYNRYTDNATQAGASLYQGTYKNREVSSDAAQGTQLEQGGTSIEANWTLDSGKKLTSISAYRFWNFDTINTDGTTADAIRNAAVPVKDKQYSQEIRLASEKNPIFDWVAGLYYFQQNIKNDAIFAYGNTGDAYMLAQNPVLRADILSGNTNILNNRTSHTYGYADTKSTAIFGQGIWHVTPSFDITTGGRITYEDKEAQVSRVAPTGGVDIASLPTVQQNIANALLAPYDSGKLNIHNTSYAGLLTGSYKFSPDQLLYATYSHGEKSGGFNLAVGSAPTLGAQSLIIKPEKADNYEIGVKQTLLDGKLQLNSNLFLVDVSDYQTSSLQQVGATFISVLSNVGKVRSKGVELDATYQPNRRLTLNLNGSFTDAKYTEYKNAPAPAEISIPTGVVTQDLTGHRVYGVPKWTANVNFRYDLPEKNNWQPYLSGSYSWRDWSYGSGDNSKFSIIDSYGLLNASVGSRYNLGNNQLDFSIWAKNLTDKTYVLNAPANLNGAYIASLGQPRTVGATLKVNF